MTTGDLIPPELRDRGTVTVTVAGKVLGIGRTNAYAAIRSGELPSLKIGRRIVVPVAPLLRMLGVEAAA